MPIADPAPDAAPAAAAGVAAVRRSRPIYRVFVSSTWMDLQPERKAVMEALNRMEEMRFVGMEFFGNRPDDTHDASIDQVDLCEVFVGIIGHRYGSGITEAEYRRARGHGLPCFIYFKRGAAASPVQSDNDPALAAKLEAFKRDLLRDHTVKEFDRPDELAANATADLHNWVAARWISLERPESATGATGRPRAAAPDADRTNVLRLLERIDQDWVKGVLEASLHHRAWLELGLDWREDAVEHPWDRIVVAPNRPIQTLSKEDSIAGVFDAAQNTLLVLGEPGAGKTTTVLELARDLIARVREAATAPAPVVLALSTWRGQHKNLLDWLVAELGLRYQVPKRVATHWLEEGRLVLLLDGLDEVVPGRRAACVDAINAFVEAHPPAGLAVTCRVAEYNALTTKLRLRSAICLQPLTAEQVDRYFRAAGPGLAPLRQALQEDAGLRELARSPLMLSVMTMAWRDAPAGTTAPFAAARTPEELRRNLFDAYVRAALQRRGKAVGEYTPEQTTRWLTWLAQRMKENGYTLFALEQLQPAWLEGTWRQFGYFLGSRLLGTLGLALPFVVFPQAKGQAQVAVASVGLGLFAGCYLGCIDFAFARHGWGGHRRATMRLVATLVGLAFLIFGWMGLSPDGPAAGAGNLYLFMVGLAFCAPVDVRALDIKPAGSIQWSRPLAESRAVAAFAVMSIILVVVRGLLAQGIASDQGWAKAWHMFGGWSYFAGLAVGVGLAASRWPKLRPPAFENSRLLSIAYVLGSGQLGALIATFVRPDQDALAANGMLLGALFPVALFYVFGGFGSTLIDPARPQHAGAWFWLRVPVLAFLLVGAVVFLPGTFIMLAVAIDDGTRKAIGTVVAVTLASAGCGLMAFFRFGGFNGAQHFLLRWLLARGGHLPARPEGFLRHVAQLALLQKVGLGYRFIHALLLQHLASSAGGGGDTLAPETNAATIERQPAAGRSRARRAFRAVAWVGLGAATMLFVGLGAAALALKLTLAAPGRSDGVASFLGALMFSIALAIPILLLTGRWLARRPLGWLAAGWVGIGLLLAYMAVDEPAAPRPAILAEAAADFPGAEQSNAVLTRYNVPPFGKPRPFRWTGLNFGLDPGKRKSWQEFLAARRPEILANWQKLEPVRAWLAEVNAFERIGDRAEDLTDLRVLDNLATVPLLQNSMAIASLQALDGQGEAALGTLLPLLEVGGKLEEATRGASYWRNAREMQDAAIKAAAFVLDTTPVPAGARDRFAAALAARGGGAAGIRRLYAVRHARLVQGTASFGRAMIFSGWQSLEFLRPEFDLVGPVVFNRNASHNRWGELFADLAELAGRRQIARAQQRLDEFLAEESRVRLKNIGNAWVANMVARMGIKDITGEQTKYWEMEDRRAALLARLQGGGPGAGNREN
ncbi:MAG TPA: DUF4062 domain-containing protein [Lacunisphaera sp.]|nr:DUF4062 domain-containing protein [Lacunisphaera sp.]